MGTSTSHRSPSTPEWERVKELYRRPNPDPKEVASRISQALDEATRNEMAGGGVACCLAELLRASQIAAEKGLAALLPDLPQAPPLVLAAENIRQCAEQAIARRGFASRFSDIALNALATSVFEAGAGPAAELFNISLAHAEAQLRSYYEQQNLHRLALIFVGQDFDHLYRYFVTRDTSDFVGGQGLPTVSAASQLRDAVSRHCREVIAQIEATAYEATLAAALHAEEEEGLYTIQDVMRQLMLEGWQRLAAGGE